MPGKQPRKSHRDRNQRHSTSLEDALNASRQHTLPVLPPLDASESDYSPYGPGSSSSTLGQNVRERGDGRPSRSLSSARHQGPDTISRRTLLSQAATTRHTSPQHPPYEPDREGYPPRYGQISTEGSGDDQALVPTRQARAVGQPDGENLPAVRTAQSSALVVTGQGTSQALLIPGAAKAPRGTGYVVPKRRGALSFMAQFVISMVTAAVVFSAVAAASPLRQSAATGGSFHSYANAVPWIPTPTPTPSPTPTPVPFVPPPPPGGYNPGQQAIINEITAVFGPNASNALIVARCESGYDPNAYNPYPIGGSHASGVFQILYPSTWSTTSYSGSSPYDANANIHAAYQIFSRDGYSWREWACGAGLG